MFGPNRCRLVTDTRFNEIKQQFEIETIICEEDNGNLCQFWWTYDTFIQKFEFVCNQEDINCFVPGGRLIRNVHRWAGHLMVVAVMLHMARVFYHSSYRRGREFNWLIGMALFLVTMALSYTGYLLPWDQLAYWAMVIGANIARSPREVTDVLGITQYIDVGGLQKELMLGAAEPGDNALLRFYVMHCVVLPFAAIVLIPLHLWRIRKDGGLNRPDDITPGELEGTPVDEKAEQAFPKDGSKTYGLMCVSEGRSPAVDRGPEHTVSSWPHLFHAEMAVFVSIFAIVLAAGILVDAPLEGPANPLAPKNPAKAQWYFLWAQELVSYSAFVGGMAITLLVVASFALVPFLDREKRQVGRWCGGPEGRRATLRSALFAATVILAVLAFSVRFGWLRDWFPTIPHAVIMLVNPGTVLLAAFGGWTFFMLQRHRSTYVGALAFFTCVIVAFLMLTYFTTMHRGPNWAFYWSKSQWPVP